MWPAPDIVSSVGRRIRIPNLTREPQVVKRNSHFCKVYPVFTPKSEDTKAIDTYRSMVTTSPTMHSEAVSLDPDDMFPADVKREFKAVLEEFDDIFSPSFGGYNGFAEPFKAVVIMGPVLPLPPRAKVACLSMLVIGL